MSTVDNRVVRLTFDNAQFEREIERSQTSLNKLDDSISNIDGKGFSSIKDSLTKFKGVFSKVGKEGSNVFDKIQASTIAFNTDNMVSSLNALEDRFSTLGVIGMSVLDSLSKKAVDAGINMLKKLASPVLQGGYKRAMSIENARFTLQGLIDDNKEVEAIMGDALKSVDQTAFAYNDAAMAAANFAATGMGSGTKMLHTLKGVAGVAATVNSDYSDIAHIFTTIAGNGRVMGEQLNQFSYRGLNAAATVSKSFNEVINGTSKMSESGQKRIMNLISKGSKYIQNTSKITEQDIRTLASKGLLDFETFAEIMYDRFGEHATKANDTFTGSLSNIKAALARTGAMFFEGLIVQKGTVVRLFNNIRKAINAFNEQLKPAAKAWTAHVNKIAGLTSRLFYHFTENGGFEGFGNVIKAIGSVIKPIEEAFLSIFGITKGEHIRRIVNATEAFKKFTASLILSEDAQKKLKDVMEVIFRILSVGVTIVKNIGLIIGSIIGVILKLAGIVADFVGTIFSLLNSGRKTIDILEGIRIAVDFIGVIIRTVIRAIGSLIDWVGDKLHSLYNLIINGTGVISGFLSKIIPKFEGFGKAIKDSISEDNLKPFFNFIKKIFPTFKDFIEKLKFYKDVAKLKWKLHGVYEFRAVLYRMRQALSDLIALFSTIPDKIRNFANNVRDGFVGVGDSIDEAKAKVNTFGFSLGEAFGRVRDFFVSIKDRFSGFFGKIKEMFGHLKESFSGFSPLGMAGMFNTAAITGYFIYTVKLIKDTLKNFKTFAENLGKLPESINKLIDSIAKIPEKFGTVLDELGDSLKAFQSKLKAQALLNIALAIGTLAGALWVLTKIPSDKMLPAIAAIGGLTGILIIALKAMTMFSATSADIGFEGGKLKASFKPSNITQLALSMVPMAAAILMLGKVVEKLGSMPWQNMVRGIVGMGICLTALIVTLAIFSRIVSSKGGKGGKGGLLTTAKSVERLRSTLGSMLIVAAAVWLVAQAMSKLGQLNLDQIAKGGLAIAIILGSLGLFMKLTNKIELSPKSAAAILIISAALYLLAGAIIIYSKIPFETFANGLVKMGISIAAIGAALYAFPDKEVIKSAAAFTILSLSLYILAGAILVFSKIPIETFVSGLLKMAIAVAALAGLIWLLGKTGGISLKFAFTLGVLGTAMIALAIAMMFFGNVSWGGIGKAIVGLAGVIAVLAVAGAVLTASGLIFAIYALCGALALLGLSIALIGGGFALLAWGFTTLGTAGTVGAAQAVGALTIMLDGITAIIPQMAAIFVGGMLAVAEQMALMAPRFADAFNRFVLAFKEAGKDLKVNIANLMFDAAIEMANVWTRRAPELGVALAQMAAAITLGLKPNIPLAAQAMTDLVIAMIKALNDHIKDVVVAGAELAVDMVEGIATGIENAAERMEPAMQHLKEAIIKFFKAVFGIHSPSTVMADQAGPLCDGISQGIKNFANSGELNEVMGTLGNALSDGFTNWMEGGGIRDMINSLSNSISKGLLNMVPGMKATGEKFAEDYVRYSGQNYNIIGSQMVTGSGSIYQKSTTEEAHMKLVGAEYAGALSKSFFDTFKASMNSGNSDAAKMFQAMFKNIELRTVPGAAASGVSIGSSFMSNMLGVFGQEKRKKQISDNVANAVNRAKGAASAAISGISSIGSNMISGITSGASKKSGTLYSVIQLIIRTAVIKAQLAAKISSPSRVFADEVGQYIPLGIAMGMYRKAGSVFDASEMIIRNAVSAASVLANKISDTVEEDINSNPVITPVVDLTDVVGKSNDISNMLSGAYAYAMSSNIIANRRRAQDAAALASSSSGNVVNQYNNMKIIQQPGESMDMFVNRVVGKLETATNMEG